MALNLEPRAILKHLNELGYVNISGEDLKAFIRDLRILIRHEEKENIQTFSSVKYQQAYNYQDAESIPYQNILSDAFHNLHSNSTVSSKAKQKELPKKEKVISIQITKPQQHKSIQCTSGLSTNATGTAITSTNQSTVSGITSKRTESSYETTTQSAQTKSCIRNEKKTSNIRPKVSFIRPRKPALRAKSDPVTLYHQYQAEWKKTKLPGVDNHNDLRWAIRERMLGDSTRMPESVTTNRTKLSYSTNKKTKNATKQWH